MSICLAFRRPFPRSHLARITHPQDARLRALGCGTSFDMSFAGHKSHVICSAYVASIFGGHERGQRSRRDYLTASLAFLTSRLLRASKRARAAAVVQRNHRRSRNHKVLGQRCRLLRLAHEYRSVAENRNKVLKAARVL